VVGSEWDISDDWVLSPGRGISYSVHYCDYI